MKAGREGDRGGIGVRVRLEWIERMVLEWLLVILKGIENDCSVFVDSSCDREGI